MSILQELFVILKDLFAVTPTRKRRRKTKNSSRKMKSVKRRVPATKSISKSKENSEGARPKARQFKTQLKNSSKYDSVPKNFLPKESAIKNSARPKRLEDSESKDEWQPVGTITHFFGRISVCVLKVEGKSLLIGDTILVRGSTESFVQKINSMQIKSVDVQIARKGQLVGLKVIKPIQVGDKVFKK